jgi:hypothetical protein
MIPPISLTEPASISFLGDENNSIPVRRIKISWAKSVFTDKGEGSSFGFDDVPNIFVTNQKGITAGMWFCIRGDLESDPLFLNERFPFDFGETAQKKFGWWSRMKSYLQCFAFMLSSLLMTVIGIPIVAIALLFMKKEDRHLPSWAWLWGNDKDGDGDQWWLSDHYPNGTHTEWWPRFNWFAIRNSCYNYGMKYGSIDLSKTVEVYEKWDKEVSNRDSATTGRGVSGKLLRMAVFASGRVYPCFHLVRQWKDSGRCLRIYVGWKLKGKDIYGERGEPVMNINPLMGYEK